MRRLGCLLLAIALLTGCWSRREITEAALAGLIGVDWFNGQYRVTVNIMLPQTAGGGQGGGATIGPSTSAKPVWTIWAEAASLDEAMGELERLSPRRLFLGHVRAVFLGEEVLRRGIRPVLDYFYRTVEIRPTVWLGAARGAAWPLLMARPALEAYPVNGPLGYQDLELMRTSMATSRRLAKAQAMLTEEGIDLALPVFELAKPEVSPGTQVLARQEGPEAVFRGENAVLWDDRLVGWIDAPASRGLLFLRGETIHGPIGADCPDGGGRVVFRLRKSQTDLSVRAQGSGAAARVRIRVVADINDVNCPTGPGTREALAGLEAALAQKVRQEVEATVAAVRRTGADIVGFGQNLYRSSPRAFRTLAKRWPEVVTRMPVDIQVQARIPRTGQKYDVLPAKPGGATLGPPGETGGR